MKKIFSCLLCLVMVLSMTTTAFAKEVDFNDISKSDYKTAITTLAKLDVVNGFTASRFGPDATLTRGQAAQIFVNALYADATVRNVCPFTDIYKDTWCYDAVNIAYYYGIVHGFSDGTFRPSTEVSFNQWLAMILNVLGYDVTRLDGTWPTNIYALGYQLGLFENLKVTSDSITRGEACQMLYNALDIKVIGTNKTLYQMVTGTSTSGSSSSKPSTGNSNSTGTIVGPTEPTFQPTVKDGQIRGTINFIELTFDKNGNPNGFEVMFYDDSTVYTIATIRMGDDYLYDYDESFEAYTLLIGRGDELVIELTYPGSGVYRIVKVVNDPTKDFTTLPGDFFIKGDNPPVPTFPSVEVDIETTPSESTSSGGVVAY